MDLAIDTLGPSTIIRASGLKEKYNVDLAICGKRSAPIVIKRPARGFVINELEGNAQAHEETLGE